MDRRKIIVLLFICYGLVAVFRLTAPSDIDTRDQAKQGLYVLDVLQKGSLFLPSEQGIRPATKPPLYNWAAAVVSLAWGKVTDVTIKLPSVLCGLGVVLITFLVCEILISQEVGLLAGLVLMMNYHFEDLISIARTDMMLCFFIALSLYFFLLAYRMRGKKSIYNILAFVAVGFGSITKGPVALALFFFIILVFLFFMKDLKWLKSMQLGWGVAIWLTMMLGWFIPALIKGGHDFFNIVVGDEMMNRFLGIGTRAHKTQPFYYLLGHFFVMFQPWSVFVPLAIISFWKTKDAVERHGLLFPLVWFLTIFIFFSISRGKRSDYLLPLYPAASILVGQFWLAHAKANEPDHWRNYLWTLSLVYLLVYFAVAGSLLILLPRWELIQTVARFVVGNSAQSDLLQDSLRRHMYLLLLTAFPLAFTSILGVGLALKKRLYPLIITLFIGTGLGLLIYFHILSLEATMRDGEHKKAFCSKAADKIGSTNNLNFFNVQYSVLFYMGENVRLLKHDELLESLRSTDKPYLITTEGDYLALREYTDFEFIVLEKSEYLIIEQARYVLLKKGSIRNLQSSHHGEKYS